MVQDQSLSPKSEEINDTKMEAVSEPMEMIQLAFEFPTDRSRLSAFQPVQPPAFNL